MSKSASSAEGGKGNTTGAAMQQHVGVSEPTTTTNLRGSARHAFDRSRTPDPKSTSAWPADIVSSFTYEVAGKLKELGAWKPGEQPETKIKQLAEHVVKEVIAAKTMTSAADEWAAKLMGKVAKMLGDMRAQDFSKWLGERMVELHTMVDKLKARKLLRAQPKWTRRKSE